MNNNCQVDANITVYDTWRPLIRHSKIPFSLVNNIASSKKKIIEDEGTYTYNQKRTKTYTSSKN